LGYVPEYVSEETLAEQLSYNPSALRWFLNISKYSFEMKSDLTTAGPMQVSKSNSNSEKLLGCDITFSAPAMVLQDRRGCKFGTISRCSKNWEDIGVKNQCEAYTARIYYGDNLYRNHHCLLCNIPAVATTFSTTIRYPGHRKKPGMSFRMFLDWRRLKRRVCSSSEIYDPLSCVCHEVFI
jgi:hypothetical protein